MTIELLFVLLIAGVAIRLAFLLIRMMRGRTEKEPNYNFTVGELQLLRQRGMLSDEEFERAAAAVRFREAQRPTPAEPPPPPAFEVLPPKPTKKDD